MNHSISFVACFWVFLFSFISRCWSEEASKAISVGKLWEDHFERALELQASKSEVEEKGIALQQSKNHWWPKLYFNAQKFQTNDPGGIFFQNLGQRQIGSADFVPSSLNHPERQAFLTGSLGLRLPLYEGGRKVAKQSFLENLVQASELLRQSKQSQLYASVVTKYGRLSLNETYQGRLAKMVEELKRIQGRYELGSKQNPIGYSGLLGLKSLRNRVEALLGIYQNQMQGDHLWIVEKLFVQEKSFAVLPINSLQDYVQTYFEKESTNYFSTLILSQEKKVTASEYQIQMERSRWLPEVGLFASQDWYHGDRDTQDSQTLGLYLTWYFWDGETQQASTQAATNYRTQQLQLESSKQEATIQKQQISASRLVMEKNMKLLEESDNYLQEQWSHALRLFQSGGMNALQVVEVLNRRIDLLEQRRTLEISYLELREQSYQLEN